MDAFFFFFCKRRRKKKLLLVKKKKKKSKAIQMFGWSGASALTITLLHPDVHHLGPDGRLLCWQHNMRFVWAPMETWSTRLHVLLISERPWAGPRLYRRITENFWEISARRDLGRIKQRAREREKEKKRFSAELNLPVLPPTAQTKCRKTCWCIYLGGKGRMTEVIKDAFKRH